MTVAHRPKLLQVCAVDFTVRHFLLPLMRAQRRWGFDVDFACTPGPYSTEIEDEGFPIKPLKVERSANLFAHARAYRDFKRLLSGESYQAVHVHTPVASLIGRPAARKSGVPIVVYTAHGFYFHDEMNPLARRLHIGLERRAQRYADFLMTQSAEDRRTAIHEKIAEADRIRAIGNGVDLKRFRPDLLDGDERAAMRGELGIPAGAGPIVTIMGRLVREKGYFEFLEAWAMLRDEFPESRAIVIGEALASDRASAGSQVRARAEELGLTDSIVFTGLRRDVPRLLAVSDLFVLPSWREGMPRSIIEAMASGLPVIASDIRGCREEVADRGTGRLIPARNQRVLADAMRELMANPEIRKRMGSAGRERAESLFDEEKVIARQEEVFRMLFAEKGLGWPAVRSET